MKRRSLLAGAAAFAGATALAAPRLAAAQDARVLKFVPQADLAVLDPIWTTAEVTRNHAMMVFDTLYGRDEALKPVPQMAEGAAADADGKVWTFRLREGLRFHDNEPVLGRDVVASLSRWGRRDGFGQVLFGLVDELSAPNDREIVFRLKRGFPLILEALSKLASNVPVIMPERLAKTDANTQVTEMIGSGPFRFVRDEYVSGSRVVYSRFDGYVPRNEPADFMAGGKRVNFDRIEWNVIPDAATAAAALRNNEVDWLEFALPDLMPVLKRTNGVTLSQVDDLGFVSIMRFNALHPPFDKPAVRHAVLAAVDQADYMNAVNGDNVRWQRCAAMFPCGIPFVNELGSGIINRPRDLARMRDAVKAAGYNGETIVLMNPGDFPSIGPLGEVTADLLKKLGMNVDLQTMDWGTLVQRRVQKIPPAQGGWNIFHTWTTSVSITNPALNYYVRGQGDAGWFGWYKNDEIERQADLWTQASTDAEKQATFDAIQKIAFETAPIVALGQYYPSTAHRSNIVDRIPATNALFWNIRRG